MGLTPMRCWVVATVALLASAACSTTSIAEWLSRDDARKLTVMIAAAKSLTGAPGDAAKGREIVRNRQVGLCLLCHSGPFPEERLQGTLAPPLTGAGGRSTEAELRLRIVDARIANPETIMPPYFRHDGLTRVAPAFQGKTILTAAEIEDVVAYLMTLKE
jgi:L-cysteine S-thiosulfotransferase